MSINTRLSMQAFGAHVLEGATRFNVWAPHAERVRVVIESGDAAGQHEMPRDPEGVFSAEIPGVTAGDLYRFAADDRPPMPDPASRFQPMGVHGPSQVVDPEAFAWNDAAWAGADVERAVI